jgi:hypothetical protein
MGDGGESGFLDGDGAGFTYLDAALTAKALFRVYGAGFIIHHFKHLNRANVHALLAALALVGVYNWIESH